MVQFVVAKLCCIQIVKDVDKDPVEFVEVKGVLTGNRLYEAILAAVEAWYSKGFTRGNKGFKEFVVQHVQSVEGGEEVTKKKIVDSFGYLVT